MLSHSHTLACEILSHAPKSATTPSKQRVLEGSWLTKKAILGLVAMRNNCLGSEFHKLVSLLLVVATVAFDYE